MSPSTVLILHDLIALHKKMLSLRVTNPCFEEDQERPLEVAGRIKAGSRASLMWKSCTFSVLYDELPYKILVFS